MKLRHLSAVAILSLFVSVGCAAVDEGNAPTAETTAAIAKVPADGTCVSIDVVGSRTVQRWFDLTPGTGSTLSLNGLPVGPVTVTAKAYGGACSSVTTSSIATWLSDPATTTFVSGANTPLTLKLHRNAGDGVTLDFDDGDDAGATNDAPCSCDALGDHCTAGACMCGVGAACAAGQQCVGGACVCSPMSCPAPKLCVSGMCVDG